MEKGEKTTQGAVWLRQESLSAMESTSQVLNPVSNQDFLRNTLNGIYQENDVTAPSRVMSRRPLHHILIGVILFIFSGFMMVLMFNNLDQSKLPYIGRAVIASSLGCYYFTKKKPIPNKSQF